MGDSVKTFCRNCSALCSMEIDVEDGRMVRARPDGSVSPYGAYLCPKGLASVDFHNGAEGRLLHSLKRQAGGAFAPIEAEAAVDEIGASLKALYETHGPRSIAVYHGTGAYRCVLGGLMERAWVAALGTPNFFSSMTIDQSAKWVTMARMGVMASGRHNFRDADLALLAGGNPVVTHQGAPFAVVETGAPARAFEAAKARGCRIVIVDPRRTETARFADLFIQPLPGHDTELFAAIAHVMLRDGLSKQDFVSRWCVGLDELRAALASFTPELAAARAQVPVEQIELAARWLGEAQRPVVGSGTGPSMASHSNTADHMIEVVNVLAGGYRRAGDRIRNPGVLKVKDAIEMAVSPTRSFEQAPKCVSEDTGLLVGEFPTALIPREIAADSPDRIRALICFGGDPLKAMGDPAFAAAGFEKLDLLVSLDCRMNATAAMADYVIATSQPFERHEITVPGDSAYPEPFVQYTAPVVDKPAGVIDDWEFFWGVAARMGVPLTFKYWNYGLRFQDIPEGLPLSLIDKPDPEDLCRYLARDSLVPFDEIRASPSGVRPQSQPRFVKPAPPDASGRLELCPPDVAAELAEVARGEPLDGFAYRLTCRRVLHALNSAYIDSTGARRRYPVNFAHMNPEDMAAEGIADGDTIEIASEFGSIRTLAKGEARLRRGVLSMTHMFGPLVGGGDPVGEGGANVGQLTSLTRQVQPINFMPRFSAVPVEVRAVARCEPAPAG
jgi:anaerobic selenocysteine-containing dehydrogenase